MPDELWARADLITPMAIRVAATLRVMGHLAAGRTSASAIAAAEGVDEDALDRVFRHLAGAGFLQRDADGSYRPTEQGAALGDERLRDLLDLDGTIGRADLSVASLLHSVLTGTAAFRECFGVGFWDDLRADPTRRAAYDAQMGFDVAAWAPTIVDAFDWGSLGHVVDVGGGNGTLLAALLHAFPSLQGTVVDLPEAAGAARQLLETEGLTGRASVVPGSFFEPLPAGAGGYVLCAVLHNWPDADAGRILTWCAGAAAESGRVFVIEKTGDGTTPRTERDLRLLAYFGGRERDAAEIAALAEANGLRVADRQDLGDLSVVELAT